MQTNTTLEEQAESLKAYLLGRIHGEFLRASEQLFPPTDIDVKNGTIVLTTRSGTAIEVTIQLKVKDVGKELSQ